MPQIRSYQPPFTTVEPTDALIIDRIGVGSGFIEAHNFVGSGPLVGLIDTTPFAAFALTTYGAKTSVGPLTVNLPPTSGLDLGDWIVIADVDFNADANNITINAAGADQIELYGNTAPSQLVDVAGTEVLFQVSAAGLWSMGVGPLPEIGGASADVPIYEPIDPTAVVATQSAANLANPNVTDPTLTNPAFTDQIYRIWSIGDGSLSSQDSSVSPSFVALRRYPVVAGQQYTVSINNAPGAFIIYLTGTPRIAFYDASHAYLSTLSTGLSGVPSLAAARAVTFTAPTGAFYVGLTLEDTLTSNTIPTTQPRADAGINAVMFNTGATALPFVPYFNGTFAPTDAIFAQPPAGSTSVALQVGFAFVRSTCQQSTDTDLVRRIKLGGTPNQALEGISGGSNSSGVVDFQGFRFIPKSTTLANTIGAFNTANQAQGGTDEACPTKINNMFIGGDHGTICYQVTATSHGKTNVDIGSTYSDAGSLNWIIAAIPTLTSGAANPNALIMEQVNLGTSTSWTFPGTAPTGTTFTHVAGGTHTANFNFSAPAQRQLIPIIANYVMELVLDGTVIATTSYVLTATAGAGNTGNGTVTGLGTPPALPGNYTLTFTSSTAFGVTDPNGASIGTGALPASSAGSSVVFSQGGVTLFVTAGSSAFVNTDVFTIVSVQTYTGADGVYTGKQLVLNELYSVLNPASQQTSLIANVGANPPNYTRSDIAEQLRMYYQFSWNPWGAMAVGGSAIGIKQPFTRTAGAGGQLGDYWGIIQMQRLSLATDTPPGVATNVQLYVPNTPNPIGGFIFENGADITLNTSLTPIPLSACGDPTKPPDHMAQTAFNGATPLWSEAFGYNPTYGLGVPATALASKLNAMLLADTDKLYLDMVDAAAGNGVAGVTNFGTAFRAPFLPTDPLLTVPGVIVDMNGRRFCYITAQQSLTNHKVAVPSGLNDQPLTLVGSTGNIIVHSRIIQNDEIVITVTGYGDAVLELNAP